ncbi:MAG: hypothetical protein WAN14_14900 [Candidatus Acidiferrales bacterium]
MKKKLVPTAIIISAAVVLATGTFVHKVAAANDDHDGRGRF